MATANRARPERRALSVLGGGRFSIAPLGAYELRLAVRLSMAALLATNGSASRGRSVSRTGIFLPRSSKVLTTMKRK